MSKYLLISPDGMLGRAWAELLDRTGQERTDVTYPDFDLRDPSQVRDAVEGHAVVINCAAYTDVDGAEDHEEEATAINGAGVANLAAACAQHASVLVHYSTDYVFDGTATAPYPVDHPVDPVNAYGRSKAVGEAAIADANCKHLIVRTSWLYAPWANNFVNTMARLTIELDTLKVVDDQRGRPTSAQHLAASTLTLLERDARGIYHVTDGGECTWYEFSRAIRDGVGGNAEITPCTTAEFPRPAARPAYSVLDLTRVEDEIGEMPNWRTQLATVLESR